MTGYEKRTNAKKEAIINVARDLFTNRGVTDVGISEIAAKAQVSQVSIYNYFGDKSSLAREALISYLDKSIHEYEEILSRDIPFVEKLNIIIDIKHDSITELSRSNFSEQAWEDKILQQLFKEAAVDKALSIYTKFIELGINEGVIDRSIPKDAILSFLFSSMSIIQSSDYLNTSSEYKMGILRLFLYGLIGKAD